MTIDKALICLSILVELKHRLHKDFEAEAIQLGIEALRRVRQLRVIELDPVTHHLPGETEEKAIL